MNKADLINALAAKNEISKKDAEKAVNAVLGLIEEALKNGEKVQIMGFGSFEVKKKMERISVNPVTKKRLLVPPKLVLTYKPSSVLKEKLKGGEFYE